MRILFALLIASLGIQPAMLLAQVLFTYTPLMNQLFNSAPLPAVAWLPIVH